MWVAIIPNKEKPEQRTQTKNKSKFLILVMLRETWRRRGWGGELGWKTKPFWLRLVTRTRALNFVFQSLNKYTYNIEHCALALWPLVLLPAKRAVVTPERSLLGAGISFSSLLEGEAQTGFFPPLLLKKYLKKKILATVAQPHVLPDSQLHHSPSTTMLLSLSFSLENKQANNGEQMNQNQTKEKENKNQRKNNPFREVGREPKTQNQKP